MTAKAAASKAPLLAKDSNLGRFHLKQISWVWDNEVSVSFTAEEFYKAKCPLKAESTNKQCRSDAAFMTQLFCSSQSGMNKMDEARSHPLSKLTE